MYPYIWTLVDLFVTILPLVGGVFVAARYRRLSPHVPLIAAGFGLMIFLRVVSSIVQMLLMNLVVNRHGLPMFSYSTISALSWGGIMSLNLGAWALVLLGMSLTLRDLQSRLQGGGYTNNLNGAVLSDTPLRDGRLSDASSIYHQQAANYAAPTYYQPAREETHATDFVAPPAPAATHNAPPLSHDGATFEPVRTVAVEQPEHTVTLGSAV